jgi:hypothetical protein
MLNQSTHQQSLKKESTKMQQIENNTFALAIHDAVASRAANMQSEKNKQLCMSVATSLALSKNSAFLESINCSADKLTEKRNVKDTLCIYSVAQFANVVSAITKQTDRASFFDASYTVQAAIKTAINFANAKRSFTVDDIVNALQRDTEHKDETKRALIYKMKTHITYDTAKRQSAICMNVLRLLDMIERSDDASYSVKTSSIAYKAIKLLLK